MASSSTVMSASSQISSAGRACSSSCREQLTNSEKSLNVRFGRLSRQFYMGVRIF